MHLDHPAQLPYMSADLSGIGGQIKQSCEDFRVEEIPAYEPSGEGSYLYVWIEKRNMGADFFLRQISQRLQISREEIGMAGLKDRLAITRQWISLPLQAQDRLHHLEDENLKVLIVSRHGNKLKPGHLHGNRFQIWIRNVDPQTVHHLPALVDRIRQKGFLNYFGVQRFGRGGGTLAVGWQLLQGGTITPQKRFLRKLALSAVQSELFNRYLARRWEDGLTHVVMEGDVMAKYPMGGMFIATDTVAEQARFDHHEVVPTGPMFGKKMKSAQAIAAARELNILIEHGLSLDDFKVVGKLLQGTRRFNVVFPSAFNFEVQGADAWLSFALPAGSYATVLLDEIMKSRLASHIDNALGGEFDQDEGGSGLDAS